MFDNHDHTICIGNPDIAPKTTSLDRNIKTTRMNRKNKRQTSDDKQHICNNEYMPPTQIARVDEEKVSPFTKTTGVYKKGDTTEPMETTGVETNIREFVENLEK